MTLKLNATVRRYFSRRSDSRLEKIVKWDGKLRRHVLMGAGKAALSLPFLPSLFSSDARAQAASTRQKSFIGIPILNGMTDGYNASATEAATKASVVMPQFIGMQSAPVPGKYSINVKGLVAAKDANPKGQISDMIGPA